MKIVQFFLLFIFYSCCLHVDAQSVYITKTGGKFHKESCSYLKYSKQKIPYKYALELGYLGCKRCKPNLGEKRSLKESNKKEVKRFSVKRRNAVQCSGKTKSGRRCKRRTKNSSGRCYQH